MKTKLTLVLVLAGLLAGCGADVATTAATEAEMKKQEVEQGQQTMNMMKQKIGAAMQAEQQRADRDANQ